MNPAEFTILTFLPQCLHMETSLKNRCDPYSGCFCDESRNLSFQLLNQTATHSLCMIVAVFQMEVSVFETHFGSLNLKKHSQLMGISNTQDTTCALGYSTSFSVSSRKECIVTFLILWAIYLPVYLFVT